MSEMLKILLNCSNVRDNERVDDEGGGGAATFNGERLR